MKYRHYAPWQIVHCMGRTDEVVEAINRFVKRGSGEGNLFGIIATEETLSRYPSGIVKCIELREAEETIIIFMRKHQVNLISAR